MSNVNIGGIEGDLVLNTRQWTEPGREAMASLRNLGETASTVLDGMNRSSEQTFRDLGGRLRDSRGRFVSWGDDIRSVTQSVSQNFRDMGRAFRDRGRVCVEKAVGDNETFVSLSPIV